MFGAFWRNREVLEEQYRTDWWNSESGLAPEALERRCEQLGDELLRAGVPLPVVKARLFETILREAQIGVVPAELFQDHLRHGFVLQHIRGRWQRRVMDGALADVSREANRLAGACVMTPQCDFGHTVPDWNDVLALGFPGLLRRVTAAREVLEGQGGLSPEQAAFFEACETACRAAIQYVARLEAECRRAAYQTECPEDRRRLLGCAEVLHALTQRAPETLHEALQLSYLFHILQEEVEGERLRSLGGVDRLYNRFLQADLAAGRLTREQACELLQDFFQKFHALTGDTFYGEPFYIGGVLPGDRSAVNDMTWLILDAYDSLRVANPKIHVRLHPSNPPELLTRVCDCIRRGNTSFVFINDECAIPMMRKVGCTADEAREYVPIGCYEPGILGREVACTGNGGIVMPKALELALHNGVDPVSGMAFGPRTGEPSAFASFDSLMEAVWEQLRHMADRFVEIVSAFERHYLQINPSPLFSSTLIECVQSGRDAYAGGAKYNNSSLYAYSNATLADSLAMISRLVYEEKRMTLTELTDILDRNWEGQELLRQKILHDPDKWGNDRELPDRICVTLCERLGRYVNALPNARGGRFKTALFTIDFNYPLGKGVGATADGRLSGAPLSRNIGAVSGMDRQGITALMRSCAKLDQTLFPTGNVLDFMLHPTAVAGESGLAAFCGLVRSYFAMGGFALHGNIFDAAVLRAAQREPQKYKNLQVRVCGWNVYFVNLNKQEQDEFIARAENAQAC